MKNGRSKITVCLPATILLAGILCGCTTFQKHTARNAPDRAFIVYWPQPAETHGLRVAVKDLIDMKGVVTTAGSEFLSKTNPPAARDAQCLAIARERKVQIVGKTNLTELAVGVSGINVYFGTPKNPLTRKRKLIPGGSSSGSAVAVADGTADVAIGTDTAGSIRVPAACCGIYGLKTTFGLVPLGGVHPIEPKHLDTVGPMAKDVDHLVQGMDLLQRGFAGQYHAAVASGRSAKSFKVGRLYVDGTDAKIDQAVDEALATAGFTVVKLPAAFKADWEQAQKDGHTVAAAGAWITDGKFKNQPGVTTRTKAVVALGQIEYNLNYRDALKRRIAWQRSLRREFSRMDFIALPTLKSLPFVVPFFGGTPAFEALALSTQNTAAVNLAGNPAVAIPVPFHDKHIPLTSLQLIGPKLSEAKLLNAARFVENSNAARAKGVQ